MIVLHGVNGTREMLALTALDGYPPFQKVENGVGS
jgi:hypothetical protein